METGKEVKPLPHDGLECEVCGSEATSAVRDIVVEEPDDEDSEWRICRYQEPLHYFCGEHTRKPKRCYDETSDER